MKKTWIDGDNCIEYRNLWWNKTHKWNVYDFLPGNSNDDYATKCPFPLNKIKNVQYKRSVWQLGLSIVKYSLNEDKSSCTNVDKMERKEAKWKLIYIINNNHS